MATTSIWSIKNNLKQSINYIINPEKTLNEDYGKDTYNCLELSLNKDCNFKNEKTHYVSCLNCSETDPYKDMKFTKERYFKTDGILAFHAYQSFKEGEVTADVAHEIGVKFAEEMFKDYEVVVATHQNTNHIHNHFIINSVSFKTGKKYNNNRTNLAKLRQISDSLCEEYGLSVLDEDISYKNTYKHKVIDNDYYKVLKDDLDSVISYSVTLKQVMDRMKLLGYKTYSRNDIITIYRDNCDKVRIEKAFGNDYSKDSINDRLYHSRQIAFKPMPHKSIFQEYLSKTNNHHKGIYGLYLYYCYLLGVFPKKYPKQYLSYSIRQEIKKLDLFSKQTEFMVNNKIETIEDLDNFAKSNYEEYQNLMGKRENLWKQYHRSKTEEKQTEILAEINDIQPKIKELRKIENYCKEIRKRSESIQYNLNNFDKDLQKEKDNSRF
ncbi:MAG: relaxase/mobilization nuclease domain-containing protein [Bacilli bacterium]|nr:relaxase/mobilization nuclease domain-containing protein [Bacilli bacterium]